MNFYEVASTDVLNLIWQYTCCFNIVEIQKKNRERIVCFYSLKLQIMFDEKVNRKPNTTHWNYFYSL